jgi:5-dehydro-2-deoxygluconokinase
VRVLLFDQSADRLPAFGRQRFYSLGIQPDWWKLPPLSAESWQAISGLIEQQDPHCRGILLLGLDAPEEKLKAGFAAAAKAPVLNQPQVVAFHGVDQRLIVQFAL